MSLSFNSDSVIGGPISQGLLAQIEQRKKILEKRSGRSKDDVLFLTSNTGWVKMTSSVDTLLESQEEFRQRRLRSLEEVRPKTSNFNAQGNVLTGGTLKNGNLTAGIFNSTDTAYSKSSIHGYRPDAGITSFQVDTKSMFGALRVATVEFKVNSIEQLDTLEALFLRPGFSMLLEWGHSVYVNNQGEVVKNPVTYSDYFTPAKNSQQIISRIQQLKDQSDGNYDGMFGIVKNFTWSYNLDGGYDCKVDLVSQGELIESLSVVITPNRNIEGENSSNNQENEGSIDETEENIIRTPLHEFLSSINFSFGNNDFAPEVRKLSAISNLKFYTPELYGKFIRILGGEDQFRTIYWQYVQAETEDTEKSVSQFALIPLQHLLILVNEIFLLKTKPTSVNDDSGYITKFYTGGEEGFINSSTNRTPFVTFDYHFALDPTKVILPKSRTTNDSTRLGYLPENNTQTLELTTDNILSIFISTDLILNTLDNILDSNEPSKQTVLVFLKSLLAEINKQLGQINDLDIAYDESENLHYIVDRKITPGNSNKLEIIDLVGNKSQVENLSFSSKLSNNVTSMMAIAAQSQTSDVGQDVLAVQKWNTGLIDRHLLFKYIGTETVEDRKRENRTIPYVKEEDLFRLLKYLDEVNDSDLPTATVELDDRIESASNLTPTHRAVMKGLFEYFTKKEKTNPAGLIPFELSLTLRGISGLKVGQAFRIPDQLIPERYRGNVGFIITGVSHKIESNRWVTDLQTQMCIISEYEDVDVAQKEITLPSREDVRSTSLIQDNSKPEAPPTGLTFYSIFDRVKMKTRLYDTTGGGIYNSPRDNGARVHRAWDVVPSFENGIELKLENRDITMPFTGRVEFGTPGSSGQKLKKDEEGYLKITGEGEYQGITMVLVYVKEPNRNIIRENSPAKYFANIGDKIAKAGSVKFTYESPEMKDHIHIQMTNQDGKRLDPKLEYWFPRPANEVLNPEALKVKDRERNLGNIITNEEADLLLRQENSEN